MNLLTALRHQPDGQRYSLSDFMDWVSVFSVHGNNYQVPFTQTLSAGNGETVDRSFIGYVQSIYKANGVIFACMAARLAVFSEARFQWQKMVNGRPGDLFGTGELSVLETPWEGGVTGDLLTRMIQDADLAGNFYGIRRPNRGVGGDELVRLRPDWMQIVLTKRVDASSGGMIGWAKKGYLYEEGGSGSREVATPLAPREVCHFCPTPDPVASFRGMSWLTPVLREVAADTGATIHKMKFFDNGATPNAVVKWDREVSFEQAKVFKEMFDDEHGGVANAYKTLYLGGGADYSVVGSDFKQMDFKATQGAGETRIAAAAGVPPVIVGLSEGLAAATYSNYAQARRRFADGTIRPLWRNAASSMELLLNRPGGTRLWYDDRDIPFLREDMKDAAEIQQTQAATIHSLVQSGFEPDSIVAALQASDWSLLTHTGLFSVQMQEPGAGNPKLPGNSGPFDAAPAGPPPALPAPTNGKNPSSAPVPAGK